jgi:hypothetical protein
MDQVTAEEALKRLAPLIGEWTVEDHGNRVVGPWEQALDDTNYETDFDLIYKRVS